MAFVHPPKKASRGFNGVTMSNRSINSLMRGSVCIFWFHSNSHISFTWYPDWDKRSIFVLVSSRTSLIVLF